MKSDAPIMRPFPRVAIAEQTFPRPKIQSLEQPVADAFISGCLAAIPLQNKKIAVAVGSRGITDIAAIVKIIVAHLKKRGAEPFLIPAMGSHGGGTEEGQRRLLADYGITPENIGVPLNTDLTTVCLGTTEEGFPVYVSKVALQADGIILINRIKPHTDFHGEIESGLCKMMAVGLGKIEGANALHSRITEWKHDQIILPIARYVLENVEILAGVAILENAYHETAMVEILPPEKVIAREKELLEQARSLMPSLPVERGDVLIIDKIGKNISGAGMDPNIAGRWFRINSLWQDKPYFTRIAVLGLTPEAEGNAVGIGLADFCSKRVVDAMNREITYLNAIISRNSVNAFIPMYFDTDAELLQKAFLSLGAGSTPENARLVRIPDTLNITRIMVSESLAPELRNHPQVSGISNLCEMEFDLEGNLTGF